jgi:hemoglobin-like flavoprotein
MCIEHKEMKSMWRKRAGTSSDNESFNPNQALKQHGEKVFNTIKAAISSIDNLKRVAENLNQIGYEHYKYGTREEHLKV